MGINDVLSNLSQFSTKLSHFETPNREFCYFQAILVIFGQIKSF